MKSPDRWSLIKSFTVLPLRQWDNKAVPRLAFTLLLVLSGEQSQAAAERWKTYQDEGTKAYTEGRAADAERLFRKAIKEANRPVEDDVRLADSLAGLAAIYRDRRGHDQAERLYRRALRLYEPARLGTNRSDRAECMESYAKLLRQTERADEASKMDAAARTIWERLWANATYEGVVLEDKENFGGAEKAYRAALTYSEHFPPLYGRMLGTLESLIALLENQGRSAEAEPLCKDALAICEKVFGQDHKKTTRYRILLEKLQQRNHTNSQASGTPVQGLGDPSDLPQQ